MIGYHYLQCLGKERGLASIALQLKNDHKSCTEVQLYGPTVNLYQLGYVLIQDDTARFVFYFLLTSCHPPLSRACIPPLDV